MDKLLNAIENSDWKKDVFPLHRTGKIFPRSNRKQNLTVKAFLKEKSEKIQQSSLTQKKNYAKSELISS